MEAFKSNNGKLDWIEAGRGLAAGAVVISHVNTTHSVPLNPTVLGLLGTFGVAYFFVLSGFLMLHIHEGDVGSPRTVFYFIWRRFGRILPTYYIALLVLLAVNLLLQKDSSHILITFPFALHQLLLLPGAPLFLGQAWTLRDELFFYSIFATLLLNRVFGIILLGLWFSIIVWHLFTIGIWTRAVDGFPDLFIHHVNLYFFEGLAVALAQSMGWLRRFIVANAGVSILLLVVALSPLVGDQAWVTALALIPAFGALLGISVALSRGPIRAPRILTWLGKISYSLYLIHLAVFIVLRGVDHKVGRPLDAIWPARLLLQLTIAVGVAALLNMLVEQPVLNWVAKRRSVLGIDVSRRRVAGDARSFARSSRHT